MGKKKTFSTRIDDERLKALKHLAVDTDKSLGTLLEEAIEDLIDKYRKKNNFVCVLEKRGQVFIFSH